MQDSRAYRSATQGRATTAMWACGKMWRMARIAGSDMTASPSQLVARTKSRGTDEGLKGTWSLRIAVACKPGRCFSVPSYFGRGTCWQSSIALYAFHLAVH